MGEGDEDGEGKGVGDGEGEGLGEGEGEGEVGEGVDPEQVPWAAQLQTWLALSNSVPLGQGVYVAPPAQHWKYPLQPRAVSAYIPGARPVQVHLARWESVPELQPDGGGEELGDGEGEGVGEGEGEGEGVGDGDGEGEGEGEGEGLGDGEGVGEGVVPEHVTCAGQLQMWLALSNSVPLGQGVYVAPPAQHWKYPAQPRTESAYSPGARPVQVQAAR